MRVSVASSPPARLVGEAVPALRVLRDSKLAPTLTAIRDLASSCRRTIGSRGPWTRRAGCSTGWRRSPFSGERSPTQLEALVHIRSIDNKTGGQVPPLPGP